MIEFKKVNSSPKRYNIMIDGNKVSLRDGYAMGDKRKIRIYIKTLEAKHMVMALRFADLTEQTKEIRCDPKYSFFREKDIFQEVAISSYEGKTLEFGLTVEIHFNLVEWKRLWSVTEYIQEFKRLAYKQNLHLNINDLRKTFSIYYPVDDNDTIIESEVHKRLKSLSVLHEQVVTYIESKLHSDSVVMRFDFPEEVRIPCEQYLLYFVQFLKDLGVEATANIQHEAGQVLFAVTPTDKDEALDKIHTALKTYLQLASSPIGSSSDTEDEMMIQRFLANVDHLKSQLRLSYMMVRTQEATIRAQQTTIASQQRVLSGEVLLDSLKNVTPQSKAEGKEEVIDGVLTLGKYDYKGLEVNLAEIYRRLKQLFKREE